jgi:aryl-alcohol dehydrogenase-like predicted oxidoreductase
VCLCVCVGGCVLDAESQKLVEIYYWEGLAGEIFTSQHTRTTRRSVHGRSGDFEKEKERERERANERERARGDRERERTVDTHEDEEPAQLGIDYCLKGDLRRE